MKKIEINKYFLNQMINGGTVEMYEAEIDAIREHLKETNPTLAERVTAKKKSDSKFMLCRIN